jgi:methylthioribose-1-phosphate isomerase
MKTLPRLPVDAPLSGADYSVAELSPDGSTLYVLDQRRLPLVEEYAELTDPDDAAWAIRAMVVRGAPAIGITAAYAVALAAHAVAAGRAQHAQRAAERQGALAALGERLKATRPTAVNLAWAVEHMLARSAALAGEGGEAWAAALADEARGLHREDVEACKRMGELGAALIPEGSLVLTHCNAGALATGGYGTALGVIRSAFKAGRLRGVLADETRPYLQGARLTAWELARDGVPVEIVTDGMAGHFMARGEIGAVVVGADRVARSGDVANKIGTYGVAVLSRVHEIPFLVAAPFSTVDLSCADGSSIPIEQRASEEVTRLGDVQLAPPGVRARHPGFDVTPARLVTALVTERGVLRPPDEAGLLALSERPRGALR